MKGGGARVALLVTLLLGGGAGRLEFVVPLKSEGKGGIRVPLLLLLKREGGGIDQDGQLPLVLL